MYKFINKLGIIAYNMDRYKAGEVSNVVVVAASNIEVGAAKKCKAGIAVAEPIKVCGRVNLHKTVQNFGLSVGVLVAEVVVDVVATVVDVVALLVVIALLIGIALLLLLLLLLPFMSSENVEAVVADT
jgi:CxxC motif-containing protein